MGTDVFEIVVNVVKMVAIFLMMVQLVPILVWVERRGSAFIQNRLGPNRVGPLGLTQLLADAVKFLFKEPFIPERGVRLFYYLAPVVALVPGALAFASIPLSIPIDIVPFEMNVLGLTIGLHRSYHFVMQGYDLGIGIVFVLGISSLGAYSLLMAGWGSSNKYSLMGALRASAQMISYELALGLSLVGILMIYGTFHFADIIAAQAGPSNVPFLGWLPNWGILKNPLGAVIFFAATFAETNRTPFDLPEAEAELVAGYHTEYGGLKMLMFYIGEYGHMMVASGLLATFYFGGYGCPVWTVTPQTVSAWLGGLGLTDWPNLVSVLTALIFHLFFLIKVLFFLWVFVWVRWTLPRFRYDQLMSLGWKVMLPWALFNTVITAIGVYWFYA
jgi:NADH-quinone oxidoreductase subunit H